jgi:hypothetical protein
VREIVYDGIPAMLSQVVSEYQRGETRVICSECRKEMIVVLDMEAMKRIQRHAGIYCPDGHIQELLELASIRDYVLRGPDTIAKRNAASPVMAVDPAEDGWVTCPAADCGIRFTLRDRRFVVTPDLWQHGCGQRVRRRQTVS